MSRPMTKIAGVRLGADTDSKPVNDSSILSTPATLGTALGPIYINADTGEEVTEDWWPEVEPNLRSNRLSSCFMNTARS